MARAERELHVNPTQVSSDVAVLVLGIDDINLDPTAQGTHGD